MWLWGCVVLTIWEASDNRNSRRARGKLGRSSTDSSLTSVVPETTFASRTCSTATHKHTHSPACFYTSEEVKHFEIQYGCGGLKIQLWDKEIYDLVVARFIFKSNLTCTKINQQSQTGNAVWRIKRVPLLNKSAATAQEWQVWSVS